MHTCILAGLRAAAPTPRRDRPPPVPALLPGQSALSPRLNCDHPGCRSATAPSTARPVPTSQSNRSMLSRRLCRAILFLQPNWAQSPARVAWTPRSHRDAVAQAGKARQAARQAAEGVQLADVILASRATGARAAPAKPAGPATWSWCDLGLQLCKPVPDQVGYIMVALTGRTLFTPRAAPAG